MVEFSCGYFITFLLTKYGVLVASLLFFKHVFVSLHRVMALVAACHGDTSHRPFCVFANDIQSRTLQRAGTKL